MTRSQLNTILIEAVKKSVTVDNRFPALKAFAEIRDITDLNSDTLNKDSVHSPGTNYFYSNKALATGNKMDVEYPVLLLIEEGVSIDSPFSEKGTKWIYDLQLIVAYPSDNSSTYGLKPNKVHPEEISKFCTIQLHWVLRYVLKHIQENNTSNNTEKTLQNLNPIGSVKLSEDYAGYGLAWINFKLSECVKLDFKKNTRTIFCCGKGDGQAASEDYLIDDTGRPVTDDTLNYITLN